MTALTANTVRPSRAPGAQRVGLLGASQTIFVGAMLMRNASGHLIEAATATGSHGVGVAVKAATSGGTAGAVTVEYEEGVFRFANSASADAITIAHIGRVCWVVDDDTVALTNGSNTRSRAGVIVDVDAQGVWVRMDEALTRIAANS